ncbi:NBR1-Ig-like domain-containing protein [Saccharomonospora sp. NPDC046836]|uniref:NBR1-Ig-like domain-containing protein n=1 Tax=Saccharomonospora sp. NPDC046836 TaxID=3156921 RepID=UPI0033F1F345
MIDSSGRRGRPATCPDAAAGPAGEFARRLWELKRAAGDPSYDRMRTEYGALASKSALSAAARGQRLPSWETTWEFVRALAVGALGEAEDTARAEWRTHWEQARAATEAPAEPPAPQRTWRRGPLIAAVAATILLAVGTIAGLTLPRDPGTTEQPAAPEPLIPGDQTMFGGDITIPDGTEIPTGTRFIKVWEFHNTGTVVWADRYLRREGSFGSPDECVTAERVPIPRTAPGESARVSVEVQAPDRVGYCQVYWKMVDAKDRLLLPANRAAYFFVRIVE